MSALPNPRHAPEQYLEIDRASDERNEYFSGEIFAMAGESMEHNTISFNVASELRAQLRGRPCRAFHTNMRVQARVTGPFTYPDVVVVCGKPELRDDRRDTLLNPTVIIEVLSPSTEARDRGEKALYYRRIDSLAEYVLIAQDSALVERWTRQPDNQWLVAELSGVDDVLELASIGCRVRLADIYEGVEVCQG